MGSYYKYITAFNTTALYNTFKQSDKYIEPNLSYLIFADTVKYNPSGVISSVSISNTSIQIPYLGSYKLFAVPTPNHAGKNGIIWLSNNDSIATVDLSGIVTGVKAGEAVITAKTIYGGFTKYCKVSVQKITPTVTAPIAKSELIYTGSAQELINAGSTSYGTMKYSLDNSTWSTSVPSGTNAGTYTVYYKVEGDSNINDVASTAVSCVISKATPTVTAPTAKSLTYSGSAQTLANAGSGTGDMYYSLDETSGFSTTIPTGINAGNYTVYYYSAESANYNQSATGNILVTIGKADGSVTEAPTAKSLTYNGEAQTLANVGSGTGTMYYSLNSSSDFSTTIPTGTNATSYMVYYYAAESSNYKQSAIGNISVSIAKADTSYTSPTAKSLTYNGSNQILLNAGSVVNGTIQYSADNNTWSTTIPSQTDAGTYISYWRIVGDSNYNDKASTSISVTIAKASQSAPTATGATVYYGSTATATASSGGGQGSLEWSNGSTRTAIGSQSTSARWSGNSNYNASPWSNSVTLIVNDPYVGHEYVEIGGVKWATMNIGASSVTDYGLYFQWGDTQGYTASQVGSGSGQKYFGWTDYKYGNGTSNPGTTGMTKYYSTLGSTILDMSDDAARANWGGLWRMPTAEEFSALNKAITSAWTTDYQGSGVAGLVCTDKTDSSKVLFFPAAGLCSDGDVENEGTRIWYWASAYNRNRVDQAFDLNSDGRYFVYNSSINRCFGFPVRGVVG